MYHWFLHSKASGMTTVLLFGVHLSVIFFLSSWVWRRQLPDVKPFFWPALLLKLVAGIGLGLLYKYHYAVGDTFSFFEDASALAKVFWGESPITYVDLLVSGDDCFQ